MSKLPTSEWNHLCWPDEGVVWNLEELRSIYQNIFQKYNRHIQELRNAPTYGGIGFQGVNDSDHLSAPNQGIMFLDQTDNIIKPISVNNLGKHLDKQKNMCIRHKELCVGEISKILDYLENLGYHTYRGRIMELGPGHRGKWHIDSYPNAWGNNLRYHVPITTNEECYIQWNESPLKWNELPPRGEGDIFFHIPTDGRGFWINTDVNHQYFNEGDTWRAHIVIDLIKKT